LADVIPPGLSIGDLLMAGAGMVLVASGVREWW
jgi:hypothetical protein